MAALLVVLHHATLGAPVFYNAEPFYNFFLFGSAGVDFFFVLSGFIIYYIHSDDQNSWTAIKKYILKRIIRIYPAFLLVSLVLLGAYLTFPQWSPRGDLINMQYLTDSLLLLPSSQRPLLTVGWTLVHEMFFYTVFIVVILNKKIGVSLLWGWGLLILLANVYIVKLDFPSSFYLNAHNLEFLLGMGVAYLIKSSTIEWTSERESYADNFFRHYRFFICRFKHRL